MWNILSHKLQERIYSVEPLEEFTWTVLEEWYYIPHENQKLNKNNMRKYLESVIHVNGGCIKYWYHFCVQAQECANVFILFITATMYSIMISITEPFLFLTALYPKLCLPYKVAIEIFFFSVWYHVFFFLPVHKDFAFSIGKNPLEHFVNLAGKNGWC